MTILNPATIVLLLQTVVQLLTTPGMTPLQQQQAIALSNQVIVIAQQALTQPPVTQIGAVSTSTVSEYVASTTPSIPIVVTTPVQQPNPATTTAIGSPVGEPSCSLTATAYPGNTKYPGAQVSMVFDWTLTNMSPDTEGTLYVQNGAMNGVATYDYVLTLNQSTKGQPFGSFAQFYKAAFGGVKCFAFFDTYNVSDITTTTVSSPNRTPNLSQVTL